VVSVPSFDNAFMRVKVVELLTEERPTIVRMARLSCSECGTDWWIGLTPSKYANIDHLIRLSQRHRGLEPLACTCGANRGALESELGKRNSMALVRFLNSRRQASRGRPRQREGRYAEIVAAVDRELRGGARGHAWERKKALRKEAVRRELGTRPPVDRQPLAGLVAPKLTAIAMDLGISQREIERILAEAEIGWKELVSQRRRRLLRRGVDAAEEWQDVRPPSAEEHDRWPLLGNSALQRLVTPHEVLMDRWVTGWLESLEVNRTTLEECRHALEAYLDFVDQHCSRVIAEAVAKAQTAESPAESEATDLLDDETNEEEMGNERPPQASKRILFRSLVLSRATVDEYLTTVPESEKTRLRHIVLDFIEFARGH
jgi:hypothetical protein